MRLPIYECLFSFFLMLTTIALSIAQSASIKEETRVFATYPFGDPNPVTVLTSNTKIYPYHKFDGYSLTSQSKPWKVITLENDYIQVFVLPEVGGKVWGAIDKTTGKEFIYRNEVMKFRNISMRGPWTSGGIEFNFGIIGHHPSTATPVDYAVVENPDGSVSCIVGNIDLPSRTHWRVNITLPADKAYFETKVFWYNPTPHTQSYYNWMTAAAFAKSDLEFFAPGDTYLMHSGEAKPWPFDEEGRNLAMYKENNFGPSKSYHVVGEYNDFFGGYYHDEKFGFGHWALYEEMPGQKLWLWALSREGGIWEDLLTDTDGQYIEFQAGRLFDQYSPGEHENPITQTSFSSYSSDTWSELWFPYNDIGGMSDVSPFGVMHVRRTDDQLSIGINALAKVQGDLVVLENGNEILNEPLTLNPAQVVMRSVPINRTSKFEIFIKEMDLSFDSNPQKNHLKRPFQYPELKNQSASNQDFEAGIQAMDYREFLKARYYFESCLSQDQAHIGAMIALAEIHFRNAQYQEALKLVNQALSMDTYRPHSNYAAGNIYRALGDWVNAMESFGWAARTGEFRSAAYTQMAEISLVNDKLEETATFATKALDFNKHNIRALQVMAIAARKTGQSTLAKQWEDQILSIDPLNHTALFERSKYYDGTPIQEHVRSEYPDQTYLELAIDYFNWGQLELAGELFQKANNTVSELWMSYLNKSDPEVSVMMLEKVAGEKVNFVFPFRRETIEVLEWAVSQNHHWKFKYYLALNYWGKDRLEEAAQLLEDCADLPQEAVFYLTRAELLENVHQKSPEKDLNRALELAPSDWRVWSKLLTHYKQQGNFEQQLKLASRAYKKWPANYNIGLAYAESLLQNERYTQCIALLQKIQILPFEGASGSRTIYERAHVLQALGLMQKGKYQSAIPLLKAATLWPENLGVGKPFDPDNRSMDYLLAICYEKLHQSPQALQHRKDLTQYTTDHFERGNLANILGLIAMTTGGNKPQSDAIVKDLQENVSKLSNRWVVAYYMKDQQALSSLEKEINASDSLGYEMMRRMAELLNQ